MGSQPRMPPKTRISISPSQKIGIEMPNSDTVMIALSKAECGLMAAKTPSGTPTSEAMTSEASASWIVTGKASQTSLKAGSLVRSDRPKSPVSASPAKRKYWMKTG